MAFDVLSHFGRRCGDITLRQFDYNSLVAVNANFPLGLLNALAESLKEDVQQIAERDERL